jgi:endo-1,4-beta-D-glucanase Y
VSSKSAATLILAPERGRPSRTSPRRAIAIALVLILAASAGAVWADTSGSGSPRARFERTTALADARAFLRRYVKPSGQVVRPGHGGDTVSEGQAYALLLAQATGEQRTFARVWSWTRAHLLRGDGEMAFLASPSGRVQDPMPASDADVLAAWALARARGAHAAAYHAAAARMAAAILGNETVRRGSSLVLAAGPWATGSPASLDPSYWSTEAFAGLARFTGDRRWRRLQASALSFTRRLTANGALLPPDWARLDGERLAPTPAPNGSAPQVRYGLDAQRLVVWLAAGCRPAERALAARWWPILSAPSRSGALALSQHGAVIDSATNALPYVASAAAAQAAGRLAARDRLLAQARRVQARYPTYYGGAWLALGELLLGTSRLGGCATQGGS